MRHVNTRAAEHLEHLCVVIGPRALGSAGNQAAADYIRAVFETAGLEVELQDLRCPGWEGLNTRLQIDGEDLPALVNPFSPPCELTASFVAVGTVTEPITWTHARALLTDSWECAPPWRCVKATCSTTIMVSCCMPTRRR